MRASFRFYAELNDHLPKEFHSLDIVHEFASPVPVHACLERFRVPVAEVDLILANSISAPFSYLVQDGDRISVYPVFESIDISSVLRIRARPLRNLRFVLDGRLNRLSEALRRMGFDCTCDHAASPSDLIRIQHQERRVLLTRDARILAGGHVDRGYVLRSDDCRRQIVEVLRRFDLKNLRRRSSDAAS